MENSEAHGNRVALKDGDRIQPQTDTLHFKAQHVQRKQSSSKPRNEVGMLGKGQQKEVTVHAGI